MKKKIQWLLFFTLAGVVLVSLGIFFFVQYLNSFSSIQAFTSKDILTRQVPAAVLLWSEKGIVTGSNLKNWRPVPITKGENPRWSPDGTQFVFTRDNDVWLMADGLKNERRVLKNIVTETGTGAYWTTSGKGILAITNNNSQQVIFKNLATGKVRLIHDDGKPPFKGFRFAQCAETRLGGRYLLTFTRDAGHQSMIIDLKQKQYIANKLMREGDCGPAWSPDGSFIVMTRRNRRSMNRPLFITLFNAKTGQLSPSEYFIGRGRCGNASISNDSNFVLYVSSGNIFIWSVKGRTTEERHGVQLTSTGKSDSPNLYIFKGQIPPAFK